MSSKEIETKLGATLVIRPADFEDAMHLQSVLLTNMSKADMNMEIGEGFSTDNIAEFLPVLFKVGGSKEIHDAVFACLKKCTYDGNKITKALFDDFEIRGDYYEILIECAKFNCSVFFANLLSGLSTVLPKQTEHQK